MPYSEKQHNLFNAISHGWHPPESSGIKISKTDATRMASEGVKRESGDSTPPKRGRGLQSLINRRRK